MVRRAFQAGEVVCQGLEACFEDLRTGRRDWILLYWGWNRPKNCATGPFPKDDLGNT